MTAYIEELQEAIRHIHGVEITHVSSVPFKETFRVRQCGEGSWKFDLHGHPTASIVYAWTHKPESPDGPRHVTVLHVDPVTSPELAVRAAIVPKVRNLGTADTE